MNNTAKNLLIPTAARNTKHMFRGNLLQSMMPKRGFNSKIDGWIENLVSRLPEANIGVAIVALNTLFYGAYLFWPKYDIHKYLNHFSFSLYGMNQGYLHNVITCHFAH